jgi:hypothetical protein
MILALRDLLLCASAVKLLTCFSIVPFASFAVKWLSYANTSANSCG